MGAKTVRVRPSEGMTIKLLLAPLAGALVAVGAVAGWAVAEHHGQRPGMNAGAAVGVPPSTITLSRASRVAGVPLRMDIALARRTGRTVTLDLRLRSTAAHGGPAFGVNWQFSADQSEEDVSGVYLVDPTTGRKLSPRRDAHGTCICTDDGYSIEVAPGGTTMLTASFPGPSPLAHAVDVVVPHFGAFRDVPLRAG